MDLKLVSEELARARQRLVDQQLNLKSTQDGLAHAINLKMKHTEAVMRRKLPRVQAALAETEGVVAELEALVGTLIPSVPAEAPKARK